MVELGTIEKVDLREVWPNEATKFTPWLAKNIAKLSEALGLDLETRSEEAPVGRKKLDILAHDVGSNRPVIIENQLEGTDDSHLGQLLTYAAGYDANVVVWIAREFSDEHRAALDFLNGRTDQDTEFFGVVVELWKIDDSRPASHFSVVSAPNDWNKSTVNSTGKMSDLAERYHAFFDALINDLREKHSVTTGSKVQGRHYHTFPTGRGGFRYFAAFTSKGKARIELYIDSGDKSLNEQRFDQIEESRTEIESEIGGEFDWQHLDASRACRISAVRLGSIHDDEKALKEIREWMIDRLLAFKRVFGPILAELVE